MELPKTCRTCGSSEDFCPLESLSDLQATLKFLLNVDPLPTSHEVVCQSCMETLQSFRKFKEEALRVDRRIRDLLSRTDASVEVKVEIFEAENGSHFVCVKDEDDELEVASKHPCQKCSKSFRTSRSLKIHTRKFHTENLQNEVKPEAKRYQDDKESRILVKQFLEGARSETGMTCRVCGKFFKNNPRDRWSSYRYLRKHVIRLHLPKSKECPLCKKAFFCDRDLDRHARVHLVETSYTCDHCGRQYDERKKIAVHMQTHIQIPWLFCDKCPASFTTAYSYHDHKRFKHPDPQKHKDKEVPKHQCNYCNKLFKSAKGLKYHTDIHEGRQQFYECGTCGKVYTTNQKLQRHIRGHHLKDRSFQCSICEKAFFDRQYLKKHMNTHSFETEKLLANNELIAAVSKTQ